MREKKLKQAKSMFDLLCFAVPAGFTIVAIVLYLTITNMTSWFHYDGLAFFALVGESTIGIIFVCWIDEITSPKIERLRRYIRYKERQ